MNAPLRLGIAGLGTVGASVARLIEGNGDAFASQLGRSVRVAAVSASAFFLTLDIESIRFLRD